MTPQDPTSGTTTAGPVATRPPHAEKTRHHLAKAVRFSPSEIRHAMSEVEGFNAKLAVVITHAVGSMAMAYIFCLIALTSLPAILIQAGVLTSSDVPKFLTKPGLILVVAAVSLVALVGPVWTVTVSGVVNCVL